MDLLSHYMQKTPEGSRSKAAISFLASLDYLSERSPDVAREIVHELQDQRNSLKMIASENYSSLAVQLAMGNWLTDKYAEGAVHHRFYAGCEHVDAIEDSACHSLKQLFNAEHVYVQPHSGADANLIAFWAILTERVQNPKLAALNVSNLNHLSSEEFEDLRKEMLSQKLLAMSLNSGGHLTHGYRYNISSKFFSSFFYDVDPKTGWIDYDEIWRQAKEVQPTILLAGYSAYPRAINFATMRQIADDVGATLLVDMAHFSGLVAGKVFQDEYDPISYADVVTSTTHKTLRGPRGGIILCKKRYQEVIDKGCPLVQGGPLPHMIAAKAVAFEEARTSSFCDYARRVVENAHALAESLLELGAVLLTGGTDNHMVILDVTPFGITGKQAEAALRKCCITSNRNAIPFDSNGPWYTSGIRIGTPALTTRGMGKEEMRQIARWIVEVLKKSTPSKTSKGEMSRALCEVDQNVQGSVREQVGDLLDSFPLYPELPYNLV